MKRRQSAALATVVAAALGLAGCGVPPDDSATQAAPD